MTRALVHRGPDDEGFYVDPQGRATLGMRRLAIIDLAGGHQPILNEDGSIACVFNGEIYNFRALRAELESRGHRFASASDTEVLVHLYEDEGARAVSRLRGMFAFAIWDARNGILLLARDRLGKKPLYYALLGEQLLFASELSAFNNLRARDVDPLALDLYLTYSYVPAPRTIFRSVRKLPAAHYLVATAGAGSVDIQRYWRPATGPAWELPEAEIVRELKARFAEAVRLRMISDVPLGCFLSGGIDSSCVVAMMSDVSPDPVKTFSIGFSHDAFNELQYARTIAVQYRTEHHEYVVQPDASALLPDIARHFGEPFGDSSAVPTWYVSQLARRHVTVALNGDGGDELFAGYPWYRSALALDRLAGILPQYVFAAWSRLGGASGGRIGRLASRLRMSPGARFASLRRCQTRELRSALYSPGLLRDIGFTAEALLEDRYSEVGGESLARMQYTDIATYLADDLLVKVDRMTMAHSLEARSPFLDHELVEFALRIPARMKVTLTRGKLVLRDAMRERFPPGFFERPKMGFSIPVADWLRTELKGECERRLCKGFLVEAGWLNQRAVKDLLQEHVSGAHDWSAQLWNLLMLAVWSESV
jgi:asparagine synthase (glutamine-hydrolysing)